MNHYIKELKAALSDLLGEISIKELTTNLALSQKAQILERLLMA